MSHIVAAEWVWLSRIKREESPVEVWPELSLEQCEAQLTDLAGDWHDLLGGLTPTNPAERVSYRNSKGEPWSSTVEDIVLHVVMHSAYHRGQVATQLGAAGHPPAYTDFIHAARQGLIS
jgi:uncharacterized damage-inducible protein DinB